MEFMLTNFRQLGGLRNQTGQRVKNNRLLRSGELFQLNSTTKEKLINTYELRQIIDLRSQEEIKARPDDELKNVDYKWIDVLKNMGKKDTSLKAFEGLSQEAQVDMYMDKVYQGLILDEIAQTGYKHFFKTLLSLEEGAALFHCFAGKDRTGIAAALVLELLTVPRDLIFKDYLLTNTLRKSANEELLAQAQISGASQAKLAAMKIGLQVRASYLTTAYDTIETNFGSVQEYAITAFDISNNDIRDLQKLYLEK